MPEFEQAEVRGGAGPLSGRWVWLYPAVYLLHIAEEYWVGPGFYGWLSDAAHIDFSAGHFLVINAVAWLTMAVFVLLVRKALAPAWMVTILGAIGLFNTASHIAGSLILRSYSPGALTGLLFWVPLGVITLRRAWSAVTPWQFWGGVVLGLAVQGSVTLLALNMG